MYVALRVTSDAGPGGEPRATCRCLCGAVRFELTEPAHQAGYCHCTRCQRRTGTAASAQARIDGTTFRLLQGEELAYLGAEPPRDAETVPLPAELPPALRERLEAGGIDSLYSHQAEAWATASRGEHLVVTTGTASGKSLAFNLPVLAAPERGSYKIDIPARFFPRALGAPCVARRAQHCQANVD